MAKDHIYTPQSIDPEDEDTDICPVCDGLCTCQKQQRQQPPLPSLKIKLTVPHSLFAKLPPASSNSAVQTTSDSVNHGYLPRKRGRPPKSQTAPSRLRAHPPLHHKSRPSGVGKIKQNLKARAVLAKRAAAPTSRFPTFVSASAVESLGSSSDSPSDSENDSPLRRDNPRDREREKARTRRELLGDDPLRRKLGHPINNEWVIRSRKTSVDLSEAEGGADMDVDSDTDEDDDKNSVGLQEPEDPEDEDEDNEPGADSTTTTPLLPFLEAQDSETTDNLSAAHPHCNQQQRRRHFVRLGKSGWTFSSSEDEESAFDADLFFRYLYDSSASSSSSESMDADEDEELTEGQDNDDVPLASLPFELAESWDGGIVFTNGEGVDGDPTAGFVEVERLGRGFGFRGRGDSDKEMHMTMTMGMAECPSCLEDGYLEEDGDCEGDDGFSFNERSEDERALEGGYSQDEEEEEGSSGDTTDEDLVGSDSLPNERAMRLFKLPSPVWGSVSAIDPLSLVSSRPRRELEMMEVVEEKRRRGKGKNKGKGRMRRETREKVEKGARERRREAKKKREAMPNPFDILEGRGKFWDSDEGMDEDEVTSCLSSSSGSFNRAQDTLRSPHTPTPTSALSPTTPVPATPALSTTTSFSAGPRKGVFVVPPVVSEWMESRKRKGKATQKAMVIIGEDRKGEDVPSPHPRKRTGQGDGDVVEKLLRKHLVETLGASSIANISSDATVKASPPPTPILGLPFSPIMDDVFSSSPTMGAIQLADVLEAEFWKDDDKEAVRQEGGGESAHHVDKEAGGGESAHHVGVVVGDRHALGHVRTPGSSTDYGSAMKKSGKFALGVLWRGGTSPGGKSAKPASPGTVPGAMRRTASGGMIGSKQAKKRRLTMNSSSTSVMKQPLVLPATSIGAAGGSNIASISTAVSSTISNPNVPSKTRQEARRERKLQKRSASQPYGSHHPHSHHPHSHHQQHHYQHMYHTHHHHPNAKPRGVGSVQRLGGWFVGGSSGSGGGSGGWGGTGTSNGGGSGFSGGFGGLSF